MPLSLKTRVAIVGGGIAGLALARALHARQIPYLVIERSEHAADGGLAVNLPGNAVNALTALGLGDAIVTKGFAFQRREYRSGQDKLLFSIDEDTFWGEASRPRSIKRSVLMAMLAEGPPTASLLRGDGVQAITSMHEGVTLKLASGIKITAELVVGADGVNSIVRSQIFPETHGPGHALLADASWRFIGPNPGVHCWTVWAGKKGMVLLMPIGNDEVYGWAAFTGRSQSEGPSELLAQAIDDLPEIARHAVRRAIETPGALYHSPLEEVRLDHWSQSRTVLVGDAAHATAPVWAEGVALALEDAIVLARRLAESADIETALSGFETERRKRVEHVQAMTDAMSKAAKLPALVRNLLLPVVGPKRYRQTYEPLKIQV